MLRPPAPSFMGDLRRKFSPHAWVALEAGRDSNINSASELTEIKIPALANLKMPVKSQLLIETPSPYAGARAGFSLQYPLSVRDKLWLEGSGALRLNSSQIAYLPHRYSLAAGWRRQGDRLDYGVAAFWNDQWVSRFEALKEQGIAGEAALPVTATLDVFALADARESRYPQFLDIRTSGQRLGLGLKGRWKGDAGRTFAVTVRSGPDRSTGEVHDLDRQSLEFSFSGTWRIAESHRLRGRLWSDSQQYDSISELFLVRRQDRTDGLALDWDIQVARGWMVTPKAAVERGVSNIPLYAFSRRQWGIELRREW